MPPKKRGVSKRKTGRKGAGDAAGDDGDAPADSGASRKARMYADHLGYSIVNGQIQGEPKLVEIDGQHYFGFFCSTLQQENGLFYKPPIGICHDCAIHRDTNSVARHKEWKGPYKCNGYVNAAGDKNKYVFDFKTGLCHLKKFFPTEQNVVKVKNELIELSGDEEDDDERKPAAKSTGTESLTVGTEGVPESTSPGTEEDASAVSAPELLVGPSAMGNAHVSKAPTNGAQVNSLGANDVLPGDLFGTYLLSSHPNYVLTLPCICAPYFLKLPIFVGR